MGVFCRMGALAPAVALSAIAAVSLGGCATIVSGSTQDIAVETSPPGATCHLMRGGTVIAAIGSTPGVAEVDKSRHDITIICGRDGYYQASTVDRSGLQPATFGNILIGGLIGVGVDMASGADNKYESSVYLTLPPAPSMPGLGQPGPSQPGLAQPELVPFRTSSALPTFAPSPLQPDVPPAETMPSNPFR